MTPTNKRPGNRGAIQAAPKYLAAFTSLYGATTGHFDRERLPPPESYYHERFGTLKPNGKGWTQVRCVFHDDCNPSLSVNVTTGAYKCFSCGAHGGDVLAFHQRLHGFSFKQAALDLGAWEVPR